MSRIGPAPESSSLAQKGFAETHLMPIESLKKNNKTKKHNKGPHRKPQTTHKEKATRDPATPSWFSRAEGRVPGQLLQRQPGILELRPASPALLRFARRGRDLAKQLSTGETGGGGGGGCYIGFYGCVKGGGRGVILGYEGVCLKGVGLRWLYCVPCCCMWFYGVLI